MKGFLGIVAVSSAFMFSGLGRQSALAQGIHFGGHGVHVDVGYPHGNYVANPYWGYSYGNWYGSVHSHRSAHLDYHPTTIVPHYNHVDVVPGHYDVHRGGHHHRHRF